MKRVLGIVLAVAACGGAKPAERVSNAAGSGAATPAAKLPAEWAELVADRTYRVDLDADGKAELIAVAGEEGDLTLAIDGAPYTCGSSDLTRFSDIKIVDMNPALPGLEVVVGRHLGDEDWEYCYIYKLGGKLDALDVTNSRIDGKLVLVDGNCTDEATVYERVADGFTERQELVASHELYTRCCEGPDCP
jgi:hypothetical protein